MPELQSEYVTLNVADGSAMRAWFTRPASGGAGAGLMVFQEAFGVTAHIRGVADRFAQAGFAAIAPELFHRSAPGFEGGYDDFASARPHMAKMTVEGQEQDIRAAHDFLQQRVGERIVCVGYCMGGRVSFLANVTVPVKAAASYYGGGLPDVIGRAAQSTGPMIFFWGEQDQHIPVEQRQKVVEGMKASKHPSVQVTFSDAGHAFFNDERPSYVPWAAKLAWDLTLSFFEQHLG